ncbi:MAG TPA: hypothetical protein DHW07_02045 [Gammaproteobacteria bacterium]|nr:hypothetical protein [Gammaproteobacteria bacterium]
MIADRSDLAREGDLQSLAIRVLPPRQDQDSASSEFSAPTFIVIRDSGWEARQVRDILKKPRS